MGGGFSGGIGAAPSFSLGATQSTTGGALGASAGYPTLTASIDANAYGTNPLLQPKEAVTEKKDESFRASVRTIPGSSTSLAASVSKKSVVVPQYRFFPTPKRDIRLKPRIPGSVGAPAMTTRLGDVAHVPEKVIYSTDQFQTKRSVKKLEITETERKVCMHQGKS